MQRRTFMQLMGTGALALGAGSTLSACKSKSDGNIRPSMRFINLAPNKTVSVGLSVSAAFNPISFQQGTGYQTVDWASAYTVTPTVAGVALSPFQMTANQNSHVTGYFYPTAAGLTPTFIQDDAQTVSSGHFVIRTLLLGSFTSTAAFNLYTSTADALGTATVAGTTLGTATAYSAEQASGAVRIRLAQVSSAGAVGSVMFDATVNLDSQATYTLVIYSVGSATLPTVMLVKADSDTLTVVNNSQANIRVVQGAVPANGSDLATVSMDGAQFMQAAFGTPSLIQTKPAGSHVFSLQFGNGVASPLTYSFQGGHDYTVFFDGNQYDSTNSASGVTGFIVEDSYLPNDTTKPSVRVVNASTSPSVNFLMGGSTMISAPLTPQQSAAAATPSSIPLGTPVTLAFSQTGQFTNLATYANPGAIFTATSINTVALVGAVSNTDPTKGTYLIVVY